jgi:thiamine-monophosphate kinase
MLEHIPLSDDYIEFCGGRGEQSVIFAVTSGEDYQLCFTAKEDRQGSIKEILSGEGIEVEEIGVVTGEVGVLEVVDSRGELIDIHFKGYDHFRN